MMRDKIIGWDRIEVVPEKHRFSTYLHETSGKLYLDGFPLYDVFEKGFTNLGKLISPLEIVYLPAIRDKINSMREVFKQAIDETQYRGEFFYAYASKANAAEEVIRTILETEVDYEMSSWVDVEIAILMIKRGILKSEQKIICNGFKQEGSLYARKIIELQKLHGNVIPVIEDVTELTPLVNAGMNFEVGLRLKTYGDHHDISEMNRANSRFGMDSFRMEETAKEIEMAPNLTLKLFHSMVGSQIDDEQHFVDRLTPGIEIFVQVRSKHPTLEIFDFGGGMPAPMTLDFRFDYLLFTKKLLNRMREICNKKSIPVPNIMGEFGRYTVSEHGAHIFKVVTVKDNGSDLPWYIIDGSVMSSIPDSWALGEHFTVLPLNNLDSTFQQVQIGGITCDSDDVYPPKNSNSKLFLPKNTKNLYLGFFNIGAYQEMLGGVGGSKHCIIPEADELIIDKSPQGDWLFERLPGQSSKKILMNLGYLVEE